MIVGEEVERAFDKLLHLLVAFCRNISHVLKSEIYTLLSTTAFSFAITSTLVLLDFAYDFQNSKHHGQ